MFVNNAIHLSKTKKQTTVWNKNSFLAVNLKKLSSIKYCLMHLIEKYESCKNLQTKVWECLWSSPLFSWNLLLSAIVGPYKVVSDSEVKVDVLSAKMQNLGTLK